MAKKGSFEYDYYEEPSLIDKVINFIFNAISFLIPFIVIIIS
jgi:hypothetical protein